ncbi:MAG: mechanosensitive ion channel family protein [Flavobacteriales bacterium]|nr:mechanosensitive ion channel family protein [Flavobacteriales bacterium]
MDFLNKIYYHNTILEWLIALGIILGGVVAAKLLYWFTSVVLKKITAKTKTKLDDLLIEKLEKPVIFVVIIVAYYLAISYLEFPKGPEGEINGIQNLLFKLATFAIIIDVTWFISRTLDAIVEEYVLPLAEKSESDFDDQVLPILRKGIRAIIWIMGIIIGMDNLGIDITAMIAGLGIGGLALALAAQDMVKNIFGGIMIFLDKPFKIGERIQIDGFDGTVEEVGLRSTRVRTLEGRLLIINNSTFSDNTVVNVSAEHTRKVVLNLGMTYDTTPEQMQQSMDILKEVVIAHPAIETEDASIGFNAYGDFALGILFVYRIKKAGDILQTQTEINLEILNRFNAEGLEFAFPTQTIFKKEMA